jgi:hypothetical protein
MTSIYFETTVPILITVIDPMFLSNTFYNAELSHRGFNYVPMDIDSYIIEV